MAKLRVGIIGCGAIGSYIAESIDKNVVDAELAVVFDSIKERAERLAERLSRKPRIASSFEEFLSIDVDVVVEAASPEAVRKHAAEILKRGRSLIVLSASALLDERLRSELIEAARGQAKLYIPSGALGGVDALKAASIAGIEELLLETRKNPRALGLGDISEPRVVFEGDAEEAVKKFPLNINIAATLALATGVRPRVRIIADPGVDENIHTVYARGAFGEIRILMRNKKLEESHRSSAIAVFSVLQLLKQLSRGAITIGT